MISKRAARAPARSVEQNVDDVPKGHIPDRCRNNADSLMHHRSSESIGSITRQIHASCVCNARACAQRCNRVGVIGARRKSGKRRNRKWSRSRARARLVSA